MEHESLTAHFDYLVKQSEQLIINERWLIMQIDILHGLLCPDQVGTWQDRALQVIDKVKELTGKG